MKINNNIPNYLKLPHIGHQWKFLKNIELNTFTNSSMEQSCKNNNNSLMTNSNICPNRTQYEETPQNKKKRLAKSQSIEIKQQLDQIDSVKESNSGQVQKMSDNLIKQYDILKVNGKKDSTAMIKTQLQLNNQTDKKPHIEKCQSLYQLQNETKLNTKLYDTSEINSFTQFFQLVQSQAQNKVKKRKCQINFFKKSSSMDNINIVEQQKKITKLLLQQKIRIKPKFSPTINIQDLLQKN
ncbi:unnamed protein product [Paramecium sonneborni]|uniref:Uncharacterized protein n=1 Tax=Paramecium sonneborni TaxID=65129 RepID=A0A8S1K8N4_9CILI|nr:unnamed protein product [Paramecium sonneborni]